MSWIWCGSSARRLARTLLVLGALGVAGSARAQSSADKAAAVELFDAAQKLLTDGKTGEACVKFAESNRLDPQLGTLLHLANCYEKNGQTASAWGAWREGAELAAKRGDDREKVARAHATALEPKLSRMSIRVAVQELPGLEVKRDGVAVSRALWGSAIPVDPGDHLVEASAPGRKPFSQSVRVNPNGASVAVSIPELESEQGAAVAPVPAPGPTGYTTSAPGPTQAPPPPGPEASSSPGSGQRTIGIVLAVGGLVGLGVGGYFEMQKSKALDDREKVCPSEVNCTPKDFDRNDQLTNDARNAHTASLVAFGAGGVLLVTGAVLFLTAPKKAEPKGPSVGFAPWLSERQAGLGMSGAF